MKICILSDSHAAALKHGWQTMTADFPDVELHFYSMPMQNLRRLQLKGQTLGLGDDAGNRKLYVYPEDIPQTVDLDAYDGFVLHGLGLRINPVDGPGYSKACRKLAAMDAVSNTILWKLLCDIRKISNKKTVIGHAPLLAADNITSRGPSGEYFQQLDFLNETCFHAMDARILAQPDKTVVNGTLTDPIYNSGAIKLRKILNADGTDQLHSDRKHMNPAFGAEMMQVFLSEF